MIHRDTQQKNAKYLTRLNLYEKREKTTLFLYATAKLGRKKYLKIPKMKD